MRRMLACVLSGLVVVAAGSASLAAPIQDRPGQVSRSEVWIQNRTKTEAVPVNIQDVVSVQMTGIPNVQVSGTPTVTINPSSVVQSRQARQAWEYQIVTIAGQDLQGVSKAGLDGWETTGTQLPTQGGIALLLKRPR